MANWMCHFDNFDIDQIASKLAQRWNFVHSFYCKKISVLDSFDNAKNAKRHLFFGHPIWNKNLFTIFKSKVIKKITSEMTEGGANYRGITLSSLYGSLYGIET